MGGGGAQGKFYSYGRGEGGRKVLATLKGGGGGGGAGTDPGGTPKLHN